MKATRVILHHSATSNSGDSIGALEIDRMHREKGYSQIGYHRVVRRTGVIEIGRKDNVQGAHCKGNNEDSLSICYVGTGQPTAEQVRSILFLYQEFNRKYQIPWKKWFGHYELRNTECPGLPMICVRFLLANFDRREFELDDKAPIDTFLEVLGLPR